jgi:hypothetical protein
MRFVIHQTKRMEAVVSASRKESITAPYTRIFELLCAYKLFTSSLIPQYQYALGAIGILTEKKRPHTAS